MLLPYLYWVWIAAEPYECKGNVEELSKNLPSSPAAVDWFMCGIVMVRLDKCWANLKNSWETELRHALSTSLQSPYVKWLATQGFVLYWRTILLTQN